MVLIGVSTVQGLQNPAYWCWIICTQVGLNLGLMLQILRAGNQDTAPNRVSSNRTMAPLLYGWKLEVLQETDFMVYKARFYRIHATARKPLG